jgi:hypothetical protein
MMDKPTRTICAMCLFVAAFILGVLIGARVERGEGEARMALMSGAHDAELARVRKDNEVMRSVLTAIDKNWGKVEGR